MFTFKKILLYSTIFLVHCQLVEDIKSTGDVVRFITALGLGKSSDFVQPKVVSISPYLDQKNIPIDSKIVILFSTSMNRNSTESGVSIAANGGNANTRFNWTNDFTLEISFINNMSVGKKYDIRLNKNIVKDTKGNLIAESFLSNFYTVGIDPNPSVLSSNPPSNTNIYYGWGVNQNLTVNFSEPMDQIKTNPAITISGGPAIFVRSWNSNSTSVELILQNSLEKSTTYTLRVSTNATSQKGLKTLSDYIVLFNTGTSSNRPDVTVTPAPTSTAWTALQASPTINNFSGVSKTDKFQFSFTKPMDQSKTQSAISFNPSIDGQFNWISSSLLEFQPNTAMQQNITYTLSISDSALDSNNLPLLNSYIINFIVNNPINSQSITLNRIEGYNISAGCVLTLDPGFVISTIFPIDKSIVYTTTLNLTACSYDYVFKFYFDTPSQCVLKSSGQGDIFNQINVSYHTGGANTSPPSVYSKEFVMPGSSCSLGAGVYELWLENVAPNVQYMVTINGGNSGLLDINGNFLTNNLIFLFNAP